MIQFKHCTFLKGVCGTTKSVSISLFCSFSLFPLTSHDRGDGVGQFFDQNIKASEAMREPHGLLFLTGCVCVRASTCLGFSLNKTRGEEGEKQKAEEKRRLRRHLIIYNDYYYSTRQVHLAT